MANSVIPGNPGGNNGNVGFDFRPADEIEVVDSSGKVYMVSISKIDATGTRNITRSRDDWQETAKQVIELLKTRAPQGRAFHSGSVVLHGNLADIERVDIATLNNKRVASVSGEIKYKANDTDANLTQKTFSTPNLATLSSQQQAAVSRTLNNLSTLSNSLVDGPAQLTQQPAPNAQPQRNIPGQPPAPGQPNVAGQQQQRPGQPPAPGQQPGVQYENVTEYETVKICRGRTHKAAEIPDPNINGSIIQTYTACYALAAQLSKMADSGKSKFKDSNVTDIAKKIADRIKISMLNKLADEKNIRNEKTLERKIQKKTLDCAKENQWLKDNLKSMHNSLKEAYRSDEKFLIQLRIFQGKVKNGNAPALSDGELGDILCKPISALDDRQKILLAGLYITYATNPDSKFVGDTFLKEFVNVHRSNVKGDPYGDEFYQLVVIEESNGKEIPLSYPAGNIQTKLCAFLHFDKKTGKFTSYDRNGSSLLLDLNKCLAVSSEGQQTTVKKKSLVHVPPKVDVIEVNSSGQCLDASLAHQILQKAIRGTPNQTEVRALATYLRGQVATEIRKDTIKSDDEFMDVLRTSLMEIPEKPSGISDILDEINSTDPGNIIDLSKTKVLREYYADYITDIRNNSLDSAFLYVLPKIDLSQWHITTLHIHPGDLKVAITQGDMMTRFPKNAPILKLDKTYFVNYDGTGHYKAVNMSDDNTIMTINKMISVDFSNHLSDLSANDLEAAFHIINGQHPEAFIVISDRVHAHLQSSLPPGSDIPTIAQKASENPEELKIILGIEQCAIISDIAALTPSLPPRS